MNRLHSVALPLILASGAIPTIPTLGPPGPLPSGIVAMENGTVYFVDSFSHTVWRLQPGTGLEAFVSGRNGRALCVDGDGHLYGTHEDDAGRTTVWRAARNGSVVDLAGPEVPEYGHAFVVEDDGGMIATSGMDRRSGVRLLRAGGHDHEFIAGGRMGFRDGAGADARFLPIGGMTRTVDGELLVTSGGAIRRINADGSVETVAKDERLLKPRHSLLARFFGDGHGHLTGIAAGPAGEIFVVNSARNAVIRVNADGSADEIMKSESGWKPTGVSTANGSLYILEYGRGVRVRRLDANGAVSTIAQVKPERAVAATSAFGRFLVPRMIG
ncbi:MAG: hypothetical protein KFH98_04070 [Gemmatimonadetes bacterium]|nr:hypothetical protein [Gemmatimonadota bacterium]